MRLTIASVVLSLFVGLSAAPTLASDEIDSFFGRYVGHALSSSDTSVSARDFDVAIKPHDEGLFEVSWTTFIHQANGSVKKKESSIAFRKTREAGVFSAMQKRDMFGNQVPHDPMGGEPYVWARIEGKTLSVHGFLVMEDGAYEVQAYHRTLTDTGMDLTFTRTRESGLVKQISGMLKRVEE